MLFFFFFFTSLSSEKACWTIVIIINYHHHYLDYYSRNADSSAVALLEQNLFGGLRGLGVMTFAYVCIEDSHGLRAGVKCPHACYKMTQIYVIHKLAFRLLHSIFK